MKSVHLRVWRLQTIAGLFLLTLLAVLVHGYHLGADDAEIYVPAIKKAADPALYPVFPEFFMSHAHMSLFARVVGDPARLLHLPADAAIFLCHVAGVFMLLAAAWRRNFVKVRISSPGILVVRFSRNSFSSSSRMLRTASVVAIQN